MKYRIVTSNDKYRVEKKSWLWGWLFCGTEEVDIDGGGAWYPYNFNSKEEAQEYIDNKNFKETWKPIKESI